MYFAIQVHMLVSQLGKTEFLAFIAMGSLYALDVRNFGAVGDGVADDTQAIQNAANACPDMGTITFSSGNYLVRGIVLKGGCTHTGTGHRSVSLSSPNAFIFDI